MQENIIKQLIEAEQDRLKIAMEWEKEKGIPNPETSVIIQSIYKMAERLDDITGAKDIRNMNTNQLEQTIDNQLPKIKYGLDNYED